MYSCTVYLNDEFENLQWQDLNKVVVYLGLWGKL